MIFYITQESSARGSFCFSKGSSGYFTRLPLKRACFCPFTPFFVYARGCFGSYPPEKCSVIRLVVVIFIYQSFEPLRKASVCDRQTFHRQRIVHKCGVFWVSLFSCFKSLPYGQHIRHGARRNLSGRDILINVISLSS